jgi:AmmeMemoRadiSam system protein A
MPECLGTALIEHAREAIARQLSIPFGAVGEHPSLEEPGATFVTLMENGEVRGCVGTLDARLTLRADVRRNALGAAFRDSRFEPVSRAEFALISVEVSLLTESEALLYADANDLFGRLRPGIDGVTVECGPLRATFLPQVWERLPEPEAFLAHLKMKAGIPRDLWGPGLEVFRYQVTKWKESELPYSLS